MNRAGRRRVLEDSALQQRGTKNVTDRERWAEVDELFDAVLDQPEESRSEWLEKACHVTGRFNPRSSGFSSWPAGTTTVSSREAR